MSFDPKQFDFSTIIIIFVVVMAVVRRTFAAVIEWRKLVKRYRAKKPSMGRIINAVSMSIGAANFGPFVTFRISPRGLFMQQPALVEFLLPSVLIPWTEVHVRKYHRAPLFRGYEVEFGDAGVDDPMFTAQLPDKVVKAARMFIEIPPEEEAP